MEFRLKNGVLRRFPYFFLKRGFYKIIGKMALKSIIFQKSIFGIVPGYCPSGTPVLEDTRSTRSVMTRK